ncbi:uncharacterized protein DNG_10414 [Cephalotrichum gorgonifer]|uniref:HNH nuclease domain-containing protein n=1 Tax=Cephalotrichum gorgonifer TaxID=2041049 RepID=A0AAE8N8C5_9PEZI|nr:uncharacterized protein DNG_10414 [Cephalotrichum gorgonifer]
MADTQFHRRPFAVPAVPAPNTQSRIRNVSFLHPAYPPPINVLFSLSCPDRDGEVSGVHHRTALVACQIIANNAFETGALFLDREGQNPVPSSVGMDGVLTEEEYFFHVGPHPDTTYPVVPSFQDWEFPHGTMPQTWTSLTSPSISGLPSSLGSAQQRCAITNHSSGLTVAHIIPVEENEWFQRNDMARYSIHRVGALDGPQNVVSLRADIHMCFDARHFAVVPKPPDAEGTGDGAYVVHDFSGDAEFTTLYHNIPLLYLEATSPQYIFARFAWTVLIGIKPFLEAGLSRQVVQLNIQGLGLEWKSVLLDGQRLAGIYGPGGSRSASTKKRRRRAQPADEEIDDDLEELSGEGYYTPTDLDTSDESTC